ncbi:prevent-host-death protein [Candidatus Thiomargarita nelsonii]|uniref:Prevent-host-death protein n=1 Tax=Candidatus Thiomargarita nelsonii TaxID=1003181 RepID=A0A0A6RWP8_9GAMM|nr:prevent-host-death protein [Candidatus Thiomargarita nelsonii]
MRALSIQQMRTELGKLDTLLNLEGQLIITLHGQPIARVLPMQGKKPKPSHADLRAQMPKLTTPSEQWIREDREER